MFFGRHLAKISAASAISVSYTHLDVYKRQPDGPIKSANFETPDEARAWIAKHAGKAGIYFTVNPASKATGSGGRLNKQDIDRIEFVHVDIDVDKDGRAKDDVASQLDASMVIDSGGGLSLIHIWEGRA